MPKKYTKDTSNIEKAKELSKPKESITPISSSNENGTTAKNLLAALIALAFVAGIGYFTLSYFNGAINLDDLYQQISKNVSRFSSSNNNESTPQTPQVAETNDQNEVPAANEKREEDTADPERSLLERAGDILTGRSTTRDEETVPNTGTEVEDSAPTEKANTAETVTKGEDSVFGQWIATDYKEGDISKGNYEVKAGDTLWEISEAVYGNGGNWTQILNANTNQVGQLANGSQALIYPGQILIIP